MSEIIIPPRVKNLIGHPPFGRLAVIAFAGLRLNKDGRWHSAFWTCECSCGVVKDISLRNLSSGRVNSCGCLRSEIVSEKNTTHGLYGSDLHGIYCGMVQRCTDENARNFQNYGGRGVTICDRWLGPNGLVNFCADMGERPSKQYSLERKENQLGYSPENCEWATRKKQSRNKRTNHLITFNGETLCIADWAERRGMKYMTLFMRLRRGSIEDALTVN